MILDAAMRVFARQGFHTCRVSDIADEAGVAYGLVYHYFSSKDEILDTLFLERWNVMLAAIAEADRSERSPRDKLRAIAGFIVDSYRYEPELMKVIVVEVTRAANTFGRTHLAKIREAYAQIAGIVERAQAEGIFRQEITPEFARARVLRLDRAGPDPLDLRPRRRRRGRARGRQAHDRRDDLRRARARPGLRGFERRRHRGFGRRLDV